METRQRKPTRLKGYDYSQDGFYFITICTKNREWLFGKVVGGKMVLSEYGEALNATIQSVETGLAPVCPAALSYPVRQPQQIQTKGQGQALSLPDIVREIKSKTAIHILNMCKKRNTLIGKIWQRSYHDHIIRSENDYLRIYQYIDNNPLQWDLDCHNPINPKYKDWSGCENDK